MSLRGLLMDPRRWWAAKRGRPELPPMQWERVVPEHEEEDES
jgi:hypothetical protein